MIQRCIFVEKEKMTWFQSDVSALKMSGSGDMKSSGNMTKEIFHYLVSILHPSPVPHNFQIALQVPDWVAGRPGC